MSKFYRVTLTKKRHSSEGVLLNREIEYYEASGRGEVLMAVYTRYNKDSVSDILIELVDERSVVDGSNCKASSEHGVINPLGAKLADGSDA